MKSKSKVLALMIGLVMMFSSNLPAFAAENAEPEVELIPVSVESDGIVPFTVGQETTFKIGEVGYLDDCGNFPAFEMWVTGGTSSTQVMFELTSSGGVKYGPCGPVSADNSNYWRFSHFVLNGGGSWRFTAYVSKGTNTSNLVCHVRQVE